MIIIQPFLNLFVITYTTFLFKADFISSITSHSRLNLMALTETWIKPEDNATPAALSNIFSPTPHPLKINFVVVYPPPGPLVNFLEELDLLLSTFPEDGTALIILGDFNIHLDKPQAADFHTQLASFDLKRMLTMATHKSGNQLIMCWLLHCTPRTTSFSLLTST